MALPTLDAIVAETVNGLLPPACVQMNAFPSSLPVTTVPSELVSVAHELVVAVLGVITTKRSRSHLVPVNFAQVPGEEAKSQASQTPAQALSQQ
jgi:hypothetical protein